MSRYDGCYSSGTVAYGVNILTPKEIREYNKRIDEERKYKEKLREDAVAIGFGLLAGFQM